MTVALVFHARLGVGGFLLRLAPVLVFELVDQILGELAAFDVDGDLPAVVAVGEFVDELSAVRLRWLFLQELDTRA